MDNEALLKLVEKKRAEVKNQKALAEVNNIIYSI